LRRFELMVEEVARNASAVAQNTAAAKKSASDAGTSAREAATRATDAAGSARAASTSAGQAASSAQSASSSAGTASTKATEASKSAAAAESSKSAAATSAGAAKTSETNAAASQKSAATSASTATTKASEAATSARDASASKVAAKSSETSAASSAGSAASSATAAGNSAKAAKTSETNADNSAQAAADSQTASANSATAAKKSETNAKNSEAAAKVSETNAKASENKAKEYLDKVGGLVSPMTQYDWPVVTGNESFYIKIAKLSDPGSNNCHVTLMVTNAGNYGSPYGNIDFIEISARGLPSLLSADNVSRHLSIRRLGSTGLTDNNQMRYGLVKGDGFIEVWAFQRAFINGAKVAVLAQTARTELYIPDGFVKQTAAPSGYIEGNVVRIYDQVNKPSKSDVGLGNVTNDAQVKKTGDTMTGDLTIKKGTPSVFLRADSGVTALRFYTGDNTERGIIYAGPNTDSLGEVRIRAKTAGGTSGGDLVVRHDGRVEVRDLTVAYKIKSRTIEIANTDTDSSATTLSIYGVQHTPLVLTRSGSSENVSIGFKLDNMNPKYLGIDTNGDLAFGESPDQKQNSKLITQAKLDKGLTIGGQLAFKGTTAFSAVATFSAGIAGAIEPENIDGQTVNLNNLTIIKSDAGAVKYYICPSSAGGANITNKPDGVTGNFLLRVESTRKVRDSDYANMQTLINSDTKRIYVRFVVNGNWTAWSQVVVSGWNQDVTVRSLTSTTPSKLGGGRIDVLGSTSDYGSMNCTVRGVDSTGTNSAWSVGTSESTGKKLFLKNHRSSAQVLLNGDDGAVQLLSGTVNGATAQALTINKDEVNSTADLVIRKQTGTGNRFALLNSGNSELPVSIAVWGSSDRQNVFEVATSAAYLFYAQRTPAGQLFDVNGAINCTTLNQSSDRDLKDDIRVISDATKAIRKMNGYTYTLKENGLPYAGVIAQEVMEAIPEAVGSFTHYGEELQGPTVDGNKLREETRYLNVDYAAVTGLLVQVARETDDRVTALEEENTTLRQNLATAGTRISTLENQVSELVALVRQLTGSEH
ncbi:TPA: tail fiber domain-containing protein, partial [Escherichia coli]